VSLTHLGKRLDLADLPADSDEPGIPGSRRFALFYQQDRQLPTVSHAEGIYIWDTRGKRYLDGCSGAMAANIGHSHPRVLERAQKQLDQVCFAYRTQFESEPANELASLLTYLAPGDLNRVFFVNSGSEAVETSIKLARQFWWAQGRHGKQLIIARRPSYHGATLGALACTEYAPLNIPYRPMLMPFPRVAAPYCYHCPLGKEYPSCDTDCARELQRAINQFGADHIAAFICEPIGGASTGAAVPPDEYFPLVEQICHENEIVLIVDDVLTGCGRTGTFYGFEHWDITPDIVAISKGLSGGYTPIGAALASEAIVKPVLDSGGFMHGHTYAGNPLSTAIAAEVVKVVLEEQLVDNAREEGTYLHEQLHAMKEDWPIIGDVRGRGLLAGVELVQDRLARSPFPPAWYVGLEATELARSHGLLIYPRRSLFGLSGDHVLIAPPLTIDRPGVDELLAAFRATLADLSRLLERYVAEEALEADDDGTVERYQQTAEAPDYDLEEIEEVPPDPQANATWTMEDPDLEVHGVGPGEEPVRKEEN
jgi:adenosylmethionine-8-amino-7-oxononanoate aminotransferase